MFRRIAVVLSLFVFSLTSCWQKTSNQEADKQEDNTLIIRSEEDIKSRIENKAKEALLYCETNDYNTSFCVLIDMKIHSGKHRMFVYDFKNQKVEHSALCAHGCGKDNQKSTGAEPVFSNEEGSLLSSLGKYKIGIRSYSQWGINVHYKLHGLEASNNNAFQRIIVLHSHTPMTSSEIYPNHLPMGWSFGCPVTDDHTMTYLDSKLKNTQKPVLLWMYYDDEL